MGKSAVCSNAGQWAGRRAVEDVDDHMVGVVRAQAVDLKRVRHRASELLATREGLGFREVEPRCTRSWLAPAGCPDDGPDDDRAVANVTQRLVRRVPRGRIAVRHVRYPGGRFRYMSRRVPPSGLTTVRTVPLLPVSQPGSAAKASGCLQGGRTSAPLAGAAAATSAHVAATAAQRRRGVNRSPGSAPSTRRDRSRSRWAHWRSPGRAHSRPRRAPRAQRAAPSGHPSLRTRTAQEASAFSARRCTARAPH